MPRPHLSAGYLMLTLLEKGTYSVKAPSVTLKEIKSTLHPGWYLLTGKIKVKNLDTELRLTLTSEKGESLIQKIPFTCAGTVQEIFEIKQSAQKITLSITSSPGDFQVLAALQLKKLSVFEKYFRMLLRVFSYYWKDREVFNHYVRRSLLSALINLHSSYGLISLARDCHLKVNYETWLSLNGDLSKEDRRLIIKDLKTLKRLPTFLIFLKGREKSVLLKATLASLKGQIYQNFSIVTLEEKNLTAGLICSYFEALEWPQYVLFLREGTLLAEHALYYFAKVISEAEPDLLYTDHDFLDTAFRRTAPQFKPDFSLEYLRSMNYIGPAFAVKADILSNLLKKNGLRFFEDNFYSLHLSLSEISSKIKHIPAILFHLSDYSPSDMEIQSLTEHFERLNIKVSLRAIDIGLSKVVYELSKEPQVEIIIPTKDKVDILRKCVDSILRKTTYKNYRITIIDNNSAKVETKRYLEELRRWPQIKVLEYQGSFNFSAMNNLAVRESSCEVVLFLNNDTEVITPEWLEIMLGCLLQRGVGAVGVKLYYPEGVIQHAGVILGPGGGAHHAFKGLPKEERGYMNRAILQQEYLAVTAACLMTHRDLFLKLGGFDEVNLKVSFNDVDYCLRLHDLGYRIVFTPYVELYHHESLTRAEERSKEAENREKGEADFLRKRWAKYFRRDPYYNPNLNYNRPDFTLGLFPRYIPPWKRYDEGDILDY